MIDLTIPRHEQLRLQNFTAFTDATFEFVPGINILIGENGTGKTHVMKALYAWQMDRHLADPMETQIRQLLLDTYGAKSTRELMRSQLEAQVQGKFDNEKWKIGVKGHTVTFSIPTEAYPKPSRPVFIPAIEMMAHAKNMNGIMRDYADFDRVCFDFLAMITAENLSLLSSDPLSATDDLQKLVQGVVEWNVDDQRFYFVNKTNRIPFSMVAEGLRKVSALSRLVDTNWIQPGTILFWDEPEVNLNPKWMDDVVKALVALSRENVQIFIATHNYVILKALDLVLRAQKLEKQEDVPTRYFSLRHENGESKVIWADDFASLEPNAILDQYDKMLAENWRLQDLEDGATRNGAAG